MNLPHLLIIRGLPGTGKSTLAQRFEGAFGYIHVEPDMWHVQKDGVYRYSDAAAPDAYHWLRDTVRCFLRAGKRVVISEVLCRKSVLAQLRTLARGDDDTCTILATGGTGTIHKVPESTLEIMQDIWEDDPNPPGVPADCVLDMLEQAERYMQEKMEVGDVCYGIPGVL